MRTRRKDSRRDASRHDPAIGRQTAGVDPACSQPGASISGIVRGLARGTPITGATVELYTAAVAARTADVRRTTGADGRFIRSGMADGTHHLVVVVPSGRFAGRYVHGATAEDGAPPPHHSSSTATSIASVSSVSGIEIVLDPIGVVFDGFD